jgi:hypothetical protein
MKLISMTDLVIERCNENISFMTPMEKVKRAVDAFNEIINYANFLKQPLTLGMFIPCDEKGNVLEEPIRRDYIFEEHPELDGNPCEYREDDWQNDLEQYQQAEECVLFDVYLAYEHKDDTCLYVQHELFGDGFYFTADGETNIEYLLEFTKNLELTPNAIKQLGL